MIFKIPSPLLSPVTNKETAVCMAPSAPEDLAPLIVFSVPSAITIITPDFDTSKDLAVL